MSIFNPNNIFRNSKENIEEHNDYYVPKDFEDFIENGTTKSNIDKEEVCAKKITRKDGSIKYLVKLDRTSKLFNPFSTYDPDRSNRDFLNSVCRTDKKFKEVNEKVFSLYTQFLASKNVALLNNAEREGY